MPYLRQDLNRIDGLVDEHDCNSDRCFIRIGIEATIRTSANSTWIGFECTVTALDDCAQSSASRTWKPFRCKYQAMPTKISHPADRHVTLIAIKTHRLDGPHKKKKSNGQQIALDRMELGGSLS